LCWKDEADVLIEKRLERVNPGPGVVVIVVNHVHCAAVWVDLHIKDLDEFFADGDRLIVGRHVSCSGGERVAGHVGAESFAQWWSGWRRRPTFRCCEGIPSGEGSDGGEHRQQEYNWSFELGPGHYTQQRGRPPPAGGQTIMQPSRHHTHEPNRSPAGRQQ
jgi:hypothetical protein